MPKARRKIRAANSSPISYALSSRKRHCRGSGSSALLTFAVRACRIRPVFLRKICVAVLTLSSIAAAQQKSAPKMHVNILNVCSPSSAEQAEIVSALKRIPARPNFGSDFEVDRGRSALPDGTIASWVRIRHDFAGETPFFSSVQYSFSSDPAQIEETLVFQVRKAKKDDLLQLMLHDILPAGEAKPALEANTPAGRVRLERFGAASIVLARCPGADQSAYEPLFREASELLDKYRSVMHVRETVASDLERLPKTTNNRIRPNGQ